MGEHPKGFVVSKVNSGSPITKAILNVAMYHGTSGFFLRSSQIGSFCRKCENCYWKPSGGAAINLDTQEFSTTALVTK